MRNLFAFFRASRASFRLSVAVLGASAGMFFLSGCADTDRPVDNTAMLPEDQRVSSVPWNKPQSWETQGPLGQLANDPRFTNH